jgi:hypothetical protein
MSILQDIREIKSGKKELRSFGLTVGAVLALIGGWIYWKHGTLPAAWGFGGAGLFLIASGLLAPAALAPLQKAWMALAVCLGFVMTRVLLTVLYYLVITPIGMVLRATGKDLIDRRRSDAASHWKDHAEPDEQGAYRQF